MLLRHGADPDLEVDGSENLRDVIAANIDNFDFAAYADKVLETRQCRDRWTIQRQTYIFQVKRMPIKQKLFNCAESGDLNGLKRIAFFSSKDEDPINWNATNGGMTLLQV